jgi:cellulose synthase/poly-beta-1,6-N-acetylglucosamine synthase-like glycosyltransferase
MFELSDTTIQIARTLFWTAFGLTAYTHVLYPLLMALWAPKKQAASSSTTDWPPVTLVIPAYNEQSVLEAKLQNALALDYPRDRLEIIVASDGSSDGTLEIARRFEGSGVQLFPFTERRGKASVVNDAVRAATGEVICLCDANVMFHPDALTRLVSRLADPNVGAASGNVRLASHESNFGAGESLYYRIDRAIQVGESHLGSMLGVDGGMYVLRKSLFRPLPPDTILDDFVTTIHVIQQGRRVAYEPAAIADENGTPSARQEFNRRVRISAGAVQSLKRRQWPPLSRPVELWQYVSHKLLRWAGPAVLFVLFVANLCLWNSGTFYQLALLAQFAVGLLAVIAWRSVKFRETPWGGIPFYFVMSHVAMALGTVLGIFNRQRVTWNKTPRKAEPANAQPAC